MKNSQHVGFWLVLVMVGFFLTPLMRSGDSMEAFIADEVSKTRSAMGDRVADNVVGFANALFQDSPLGMIAQVAKTAKHTKEEQRLSGQVAGSAGKVMSSLFNSYLQGLVLQAYVVAIRFAIVLAWLIFLAPMLFASVYDGFMQRAVKREEFGQLRPATFTLLGVIVIPVVMLPLVYLIIPFSLSPLLAPAWAFVVAWPLGKLVANMQPMFGR